ncbi:hypothetical protein [Pseudonocardia pini]|uniref:hypothetical protein n=1 Tax=Pseudonocardia pini TaxID=2758030 RepID=UPI0015F0B02E|nr:hypothetical protein [Pseudonocardia pini]
MTELTPTELTPTELTATERGRQFVAAKRDAVANRVAAAPGAWMGIPGWAKWFRRAYQVLGRDLSETARRRP